METLCGDVFRHGGRRPWDDGGVGLVRPYPDGQPPTTARAVEVFVEILRDSARLHRDLAAQDGAWPKWATWAAHEDGPLARKAARATTTRKVRRLRKVVGRISTAAQELIRRVWVGDWFFDHGQHRVRFGPDYV